MNIRSILLILTFGMFLFACQKGNDMPREKYLVRVERDQIPKFKGDLSEFAQIHSLKYLDDSRGVAERRKAVGIDDIADFDKNSLSYDSKSVVSSKIELPYTPLVQSKAHIVAHNGGVPAGFVSIYVNFDRENLSQARLVNQFRQFISKRWKFAP